MRSTSINIMRFDADENKVFDWKEARFIETEDKFGNEIKIQEHLYAKTLFIGPNDSITNYIEIDAPVKED